MKKSPAGTRIRNSSLGSRPLSDAPLAWAVFVCLALPSVPMELPVEAVIRAAVAVARSALPVMGPGPGGTVSVAALKYMLTAVLPLTRSTADVAPVVGLASDCSTMVKRTWNMTVGGDAVVDGDGPGVRKAHSDDDATDAMEW